MKRFWLALGLVLTVVPASSLEAQRDSDASRRAAVQAYRDSLETEVIQKFVGRLAHDLKLDTDQRATVHGVLTAGSAQRRELARASKELRGRLIRAVRSDETTDAEFQRLLASHEALRTREHDMWTRDQQELAAVLNPRQRAYFLLSWSHFQETLRDIMSRRPGGRDSDEEHRRSQHRH